MFNLEIGCGTALSGIVACKLGAKVILSDEKTAEPCLRNCQETCLLNNVQADVVGLSWGDLESSICDLHCIDVILASDCFYDKQGCQLLYRYT